MNKKLIYTTIITIVIGSIYMFIMPAVASAAESGDLIKLQCVVGAEANDPCRAVYYLGADSKRYVFPNEKTYKTWYSDFLGVKTVSSAELSSYMIGGNVTYRPGIKLVKITTDPKVYAVDKNGNLRWLETTEVVQTIYGADWANMVEDIPDAFFINYTVGNNIAAAADYNKEDQINNATSINTDKSLESALDIIESNIKAKLTE